MQFIKIQNVIFISEKTHDDGHGIKSDMFQCLRKRVVYQYKCT